VGDEDLGMMVARCDKMEWKKEDARGRKSLGAPEAGEKKGALSLSFFVFFRSGPPHILDEMSG
jgi:hypothetical protein